MIVLSVHLQEYIQDLPTLLRHALSALFSAEGMVFMFRFRIILCLAFALVYICLPFDLLPEFVFGVFGLIDDIIVVLMFAVYITIVYRDTLGNPTETQPTTGTGQNQSNIRFTFFVSR